MGGMTEGKGEGNGDEREEGRVKGQPYKMMTEEERKSVIGGKNGTRWGLGERKDGTGYMEGWGYEMGRRRNRREIRMR